VFFPDLRLPPSREEKPQVWKSASPALRDHIESIAEIAKLQGVERRLNAAAESSRRLRRPISGLVRFSSQVQRGRSSQVQQSLHNAQRSQMWLSQVSRVQREQISVEGSPQM
jgi:hypothetical protein